jgi:enoyl-CoA hydratase/carnithine racemase
MSTTSLANYANKYQTVEMQRNDGILELALHTNGRSLIWSPTAHRELGNAFADIAADVENHVVILRGVGDNFCAGGDAAAFAELLSTPAGWVQVYREGRRLYENLLDIPVPMVGIVNGPASGHPALALLCDIVIAAPTAVFSDIGHFGGGIVPGDGVHLLWPLLLGPNRGRYFLLTGQQLSAEEALRLGVVGEIVHGPDQLLKRGRELAEQIRRAPRATLTLTRAAITCEIRRIYRDYLGYGLALEGLGAVAAGNGE